MDDSQIRIDTSTNHVNTTITMTYEPTGDRVSHSFKEGTESRHRVRQMLYKQLKAKVEGND